MLEMIPNTPTGGQQPGSSAAFGAPLSHASVAVLAFVCSPAA